MSNKDKLKLELNLVLQEKCSSNLENHLDEVFPDIFIGDQVAAKSLDILKAYGITHVLNAAALRVRAKYVPKSHFKTFRVVNTNQDWYNARHYDCVFKGFEALDMPGFNLAKYFQEAADFIESALAANGRILVHCYVGMSRSATFVIVYLMLKQNMRAKDAISLIRKKRACYPNSGFLEQIIDLEVKLQGLA